MRPTDLDPGQKNAAAHERGAGVDLLACQVPGNTQPGPAGNDPGQSFRATHIPTAGVDLLACHSRSDTRRRGAGNDPDQCSRATQRCFAGVDLLPTRPFAARHPRAERRAGTLLDPGHDSADAQAPGAGVDLLHRAKLRAFPTTSPLGASSPAPSTRRHPGTYRAGGDLLANQRGEQ